MSSVASVSKFGNASITGSRSKTASASGSKIADTSKSRVRIA